MSFSAHRRKITTAVIENILFLIYCNIKYIYSLHQMETEITGKCLVSDKMR